jgi:ribosome-associated protein
MNKRKNTDINATQETDFEQEIGEEEFKSKTQLKQEADDLKKLGFNLVELSKPQLRGLGLDEELLTAIELAQKINRKKDGFRRQLQLIGKMLRSRDIAPIELGLEKLKAPHLAATQVFHKLEKLRDEILSNGDKAIQDAVEKYPNLDRQKLRQLHRQAVKQKEAEKPPVAAREIFQYLKLTIDE